MPQRHQTPEYFGGHCLSHIKAMRLRKRETTDQGWTKRFLHLLQILPCPRTDLRKFKLRNLHRCLVSRLCHCGVDAWSTHFPRWKWRWSTCWDYQNLGNTFKRINFGDEPRLYRIQIPTNQASPLGESFQTQNPTRGDWLRFTTALLRSRSQTQAPCRSLRPILWRTSWPQHSSSKWLDDAWSVWVYPRRDRWRARSRPATYPSVVQPATPLNHEPV